MATMFASTIVILEPFHLNEGLADRGRELFYSVAAFGYPKAKISPKAIVVTLSDRSLKGRPWPPNEAFQATALQEIADRNPKAIFVDMAMIDDRKDPDHTFFMNTIKDITKTVPIYLAAAPGRTAVSGALPDLVELARTDKNFSLVSVQLGRRIGSEYAYNLSNRTKLRPAAVALYEDLNPHSPALRKHSAEEQMDVWWGVPRNSILCKDESISHACAMTQQGVVGRLFSLLAIGILPVFPDQENLSKLDIPYAPTFDIRDIEDGDAASVVDPLVKGAVVFYGGDFDLASDHIQTPLQDSVAGIHIHAMAYDNLVTMEGRFIGDRPPLGMSERQHTLLLIVILAAATLAGRWIATTVKPRLALQPHLREEQFRRLDASILAAVAVTISVFEFEVLRVGPGIWASVLVAAVSGDLLATRGLAGLVLIRCLGRQHTAKMAVRTKRRWRR
jgi:hypothetical protein